VVDFEEEEFVLENEAGPSGTAVLIGILYPAVRRLAADRYLNLNEAN
jgi:hypothetical protein